MLNVLFFKHIDYTTHLRKRYLGHYTAAAASSLAPSERHRLALVA